MRDYVWWSGLTVRDARRGIELAEPALVQEKVDGDVYWWIEPAAHCRAGRRPRTCCRTTTSI